ncbi:hypothetical protein VP01_588g2 [Puccinia sorghi]|uniref:Uncharacterized protein n=1 Tax=Puccinia sorghi TaxID=27349 RepID=A0A0L6UHV0_9BASI|nr:hypothetical protein VP01_588g2 [Puccinia sorghi]
MNRIKTCPEKMNSSKQEVPPRRRSTPKTDANLDSFSKSSQKHVQSTQKVNPVQSTQKILAIFEAPQYLKHFPPIICQYVDKILDVEMLSWMSGKRSKTVSSCNHNSNCIKASSMKLTEWLREYMPVFYYGKSWSQSLFPSTTLSNNNPPIFIGLTESWHFVILKIKDESSFSEAQWERRTGKSFMLIC